MLSSHGSASFRFSSQIFCFTYVVEGLGGPLYGWIKFGLEEYFDPDPMSMRASNY
jgi:hypothetical protein